MSQEFATPIYYLGYVAIQPIQVMERLSKLEDPRRLALKAGLEQLSDEEIWRILDTPDNKMLFDGGNYCEYTGNYCPLAVALDIPKFFNETFAIHDHLLSQTIGLIGSHRSTNFLYNQMHGIPGEFYRNNRPSDLREVCHEIVAERQKAREELC